jgi:hypothetical protein
MKRVLKYFVFLLITGIYAQIALAANISGNWEAAIMGHQVKAVAEQNGKNIKGVAYLYDPIGHKSTWHFKGMISGDNIQAAHHSGHRFTGKIVSSGKMSGILETSNGFRIPLDIYSAR